MNIFYTPELIEQKTLTLSESESKHAIRVLRLKQGDPLTLVNGVGVFFEATIIRDHPKKCEVEITHIKKETNTKPQLHVAIAPTKNNDRTEWFIEKCTEIGITQISPILCAHSERKKINHDRFAKTAISAMKQSLKATLPVVTELTPFDQFIKTPFNGKKYIAHCYSENQKHYKELYPRGENSLVLIGPEGDFSPDEVQLAIENGFEPVTFGTSRLRTETAGVVACTAFNLLNE